MVVSFVRPQTKNHLIGQLFSNKEAGGQSFFFVNLSLHNTAPFITPYEDLVLKTELLSSNTVAETLLPHAREARTRGRVIGVSVDVCVFVDTKTSSLSETGQFMSSTYYVPVRNRKILASTYLTNESVRQGAKKSRLFNFFHSIETTI